VKLLQELCAGSVVTFGPGRPLPSMIEEIGNAVRELLSLPPGWCPATKWQKFEPYTASAVTARLADVFNRTVRSATTDPSCSMRPEFLK